MPVTSASVKVELTSGWPKRVPSVYGRVEVHLVRVQREQREPDVVGLGDRPAEAALVDVADVEVLVEAPAPDLRRGLSSPSSLGSSRLLRSLEQSPRPLRPRAGRSARRRGRPRPGRPSRLPRRPRRPVGPSRPAPRPARTPGSRSPTWAGWMHIFPPKPSERASSASRLEARVVSRVEVDDVERRRGPRRPPSRRRASSGRRGSPGRPAAARGGTRPRGRPHRARAPRRAVGTPSRRRAGAPSAVSTIAITGGPLEPSASTDSGVAFGSTIASRASPPSAARSSSQKSRVRAVDANHPQAGLAARGKHPRGQLPRRLLLLGRDGVLEVGDHSVGVGLERARQLALVGAGREEEGAEVREAGGRHRRAPDVYMSDIRIGCQPGALVIRARVGCRLTGFRKSDINTGLCTQCTGGRGVKAVRFHEFGGLDVLKLEEVEDPKAGPGQVVVRVDGVRAQPPRRRHPRGRLAVPDRIAAHPRRRDRRHGSRRSGEGVDGLEVGEPRSPPYLPRRRAPPSSACHAPGGYAEKIVVSRDRSSCASPTPSPTRLRPRSRSRSPPPGTCSSTARSSRSARRC